MPRYIAPKNSTEHRVAAIALYRALLSQCSSAPLPAEDRTSLRNAVRNKFRKNRKLQSPHQLGLIFRAGYETLDHLDALTAGNAASASYLKSLIVTLPRGLTRTPPTRPRPLPPQPPQPVKHELACLPPEKKVLNVRPHAQVSGIRRVPVLASANGIPFLRIKKPQPPSLSRMLRQKLQRRQDLFDTKVELKNYWTPIAVLEDQWDMELSKQSGITEDDGCKWVDVMEVADELNRRAYLKEMEASRETARKMVEIVDAETVLALKEGHEVTRGRRHKPIRRR